MNLDIPYFSLLSLVALLLENNVDEKSMQNIDVRIHVKLGVKLPIEILSRLTPQPPFPYQKKKNNSLISLLSRKKFRLRQKIWTLVKKTDPRKNFLSTQPT